MNKFSEKLKAWRRFRKQTQMSAAIYLGVNLDTYRGWENGRHEPPAGYRKLLEEKLT